MTNVVGIDKKQTPCPFCGKKPSCPDWTCPRLASVTIDTDGTYTVEFVDPHWQEEEPPVA